MAEHVLKIVPALSIRGGLAVTVKGSGYSPLKIKGKVPEPALLIEDLLDIYGNAMVLDIDGISDGKPQYDLLKDMCSKGDVWVDPGVEGADCMIDATVAGAAAVVVGTKTLASWDELEDASDMAEGVVLSIDYDGSVISPDPAISKARPEELARRAKSLGITTVLLADYRRPGGGAPLDERLIGALVAAGSAVYVGGGVSKSEFPVLEKLRARGAVIDMAEVLRR